MNKTLSTRSTTASQLKLLVLTLSYPHRASYYDDWTDAIRQSELFSADVLTILGLPRSQLQRMIDEYDAVIVLHSCTADTTRYLERIAPALAQRRRARLLAFVGNEYNSPYLPLAKKIEVLRNCRPDVVATQLLEEAGHFLYQDLATLVVSLPHALNDAVYRPPSAEAQRRIDIGVRAFRYSAVLGDDDRNRIIDYFGVHGADHGLAVDVSYTQRLTRVEWASFLAMCRGTVSSEAGSWYLDRDDALIRRVREYLIAKRLGPVLREENFARPLVRRLPYRWKSWLAWILRHGPVRYESFEDAQVDFADLYEQFFKGAPRCPVYSKAISSRHLDAVGTKTCQILMEGRYNDILVENEHYLSVKSDLHNVHEVVRRFRDADERKRIADTAYTHVLAGHTYAHRMKALDRAIRSV